MKVIELLKKSQENSEGKKGETHILKKLFDGDTGLQTVINHDGLIDKSGYEHVIIQTEANRIAQKAVEALKKSRTVRDR